MPEDMGSVAVESPEIASGGAESVDSVVESPEITTSEVEGSDESTSAAEKTDLTDKTAGKGKLNLAEVVKKSGDALKAINPALPQAIRTAAFELGGLYREFPGGLKEAVQVRNTLSEIGGPEGIKETQEAIADYGRLESLFEKGDPAFMERLAEALPQSFSQIMPAGLEKWKQSDPEMYNHVQAKVLVQTLDGINLSRNIEQIWGRLDPEKQAAERDALAEIWNAVDRFRKAGEKAPERKTNPQDEALTKREQELEAREQKAFLTPLATEGRNQIASITDREMNTSYKWNETDPDIKTAVSERVRIEVVKASQNDKTFANEFQRLKDRGDAAGLSRHVKNFQERVTPGIVQRVARLFAVKPKGAGTVVAKKPVVATNGNGKQDSSWIRIAAQPSVKDIDRAKTTDDMILSNRAIFKDGRRVQWA